MNGLGILAVGVGAAVGAWLRWALGVLLNGLFPAIPPGTLVANLIGGYVVGGAIGYFAQAPSISPEWRLLIITGFCGGLTTFSTFSAEITQLFQLGRFGAMAGAIALHVGGSLAMTLLGIGTVRWLTAQQ
jgi:CrcB protein